MRNLWLVLAVLPLFGMGPCLSRSGTSDATKCGSGEVCGSKANTDLTPIDDPGTKGNATGYFGLYASLLVLTSLLKIEGDVFTHISPAGEEILDSDQVLYSPFVAVVRGSETKGREGFISRNLRRYEKTIGACVPLYPNDRTHDPHSIWSFAWLETKTPPSINPADQDITGKYWITGFPPQNGYAEKRFMAQANVISLTDEWVILETLEPPGVFRFNRVDQFTMEYNFTSPIQVGGVAECGMVYLPGTE